MAKAYSYVRMSTSEQLKGDSRRRQNENAKRYAVDNGLTLDTDLTFEDIGVSAFHGLNLDTGRLGKFLEAVDSGRIEKGAHLLVESLDRLSRDHIHKAVLLLLDLLGKGITVATLLDGKVYRPNEDSNVAMADLMLGVMLMSRAHEESAIKSKRLKEAWSNKRLNASTKKLTSKCPMWLTLDKNQNVFVEIKSRSSIVKDIFELCASGFGSYVICKHLNERKIPTFGNARGWQKSYVEKILNNRSVLGEFQPRTKSSTGRPTAGDAIIGYFPRIVPEDLFYKATTMRALRRTQGGGRRGPQVSNLFSKIAVCGYCRGAMHYLNRGRSGGTTLVCDRGRRGLGCTTVGWNYEDFERDFLTYVTDIDISKYFDDGVDAKILRDLENDAITKTGLRNDVESRLEKLIAALEESETEVKPVLTRITELEEKRYLYQEQLDNIGEKIALQRLSMNNRVDSKSGLQALIKRLQSESDERLIVRSKLAQSLQQTVEVLRIFTSGESWDMEDDAIQFERDNELRILTEYFNSEAKARQWISKKYETFPPEQRYFQIVFSSGRHLLVTPKSTYPTVQVGDA